MGIIRKKKQESVQDYFDHLISSISPIVTFGKDEKIRFVNSSFVREFCEGEEQALGSNIFKILQLNQKDKNSLLNRIKEGKDGYLVNSEFRSGNRVYGFTVFGFDDDTGIILKDITDKKKLETKIKKLHSEILRLQEKERQRLAAELHDGVGQTILAAKLNFVAYKNSPDKLSDKFDAGLELIDRVSQELREIYTDLYPSLLRDLGLESAIRSFLKSMFKPLNTRIECKIQIPQRLSHDLGVNLYRITQELATNSAKHAKPGKINFTLVKKASALILEFEDDGSGFDPSNIISNGFGLENIRRRVDDFGGKLNIKSSAKGSIFMIEIPVVK